MTTRPCGYGYAKALSPMSSISYPNGLEVIMNRRTIVQTLSERLKTQLVESLWQEPLSSLFNLDVFPLQQRACPDDLISQ